MNATLRCCNFLLAACCLTALAGCATVNVEKQSLPQEPAAVTTNPPTPVPAEAVAPSPVVAPSPLASIVDPASGIELLLVKGGCFQMGDVLGIGEADEKPVHEVCLSDFYLGKSEVTQEQWERVMGVNPSGNKQCGKDCAIENVSWIAVQEFIGKLREKSGKQYRLPTEAEWEYAARSGGGNDTWSGTGNEAELPGYAWFNANGGLQHRVGTARANRLGLHDLSGNVEEWCQDWYSETYYRESPRSNPTGPATGEKRVLRGGSSNDDKAYIRTTARDSDPPDAEQAGFRLALPVP